jgi:cytochrome c5
MQTESLNMKLIAALIAAAWLALLPGTAAADQGAAKPGDQTVENVCSACHEDGLLGAPRIGDASQWKARLSTAGSVDNLAAIAAHGIGNMPPRGGQSSLTDDDLKAAIRVMLSRSGT